MSEVTYRPPREDDIPQIVAMENERNRALGYPESASAAAILHNWSAPDFDRERHAIVAEIAGKIVGKAGSRVSKTSLQAWGNGYVAPPYRGRGIGSRLIDWIIEAARTDQDGTGTVLYSTAMPSEPDATDLLLSRGFRYDRTFFEMCHDAPAAAPEPVVPAGIRLRNDLRGDELVDTFCAAYNGSFIDHWNFHPMERSAAEASLAHPDMDPSLMWFAFGKDGAIAGHAALFADRSETETLGVVLQLGTTRPFRGIGLGRALLRLGLRRLADAGATRAVLGVDAKNPSGALGFYERAGFFVMRESRAYILPLR